MENNVVPMVNKGTGGQLVHHGLIQLAIRIVLNVFYLGSPVSEARVLHAFFQFAGLSFAPFRVNQLGKTLIKGHLADALGIGILSSQFIGHPGHFHGLQHGFSRLVNHLDTPPFRLR